jgi:CRP-like cAMP-binding protein
MMKEVAQFGPGKSFGEKSIEENKPRAATVYVKSKTILVAELTRMDYLKVIGNSFKN